MLLSYTQPVLPAPLPHPLLLPHGCEHLLPVVGLQRAVAAVGEQRGVLAEGLDRVLELRGCKGHESRMGNVRKTGAVHCAIVHVMWGDTHA